MNKIKEFFSKCNEKKNSLSDGSKLLFRLCICSFFILLALVVGSLVQTAGWSAKIKDLRNVTNTGTITLQANDTTEPANYTVSGKVESGILIIPKNATPETPAPAIVLTHGLYNNREMQLQNGIELARRGFVVILLDREGHGNNQTTTRNNYGDTMLQAAKYLYNLTNDQGEFIVDKTKIAVSGHSMGGNATYSATALDGVDTTGRITTSNRDGSTTSNSWAGNTDEALKAGYHMGIISAAIVQANNLSSSNFGSNLLGVAGIKASSDEFFYSATTKEPVYVAINKDSMKETTFVTAQTTDQDAQKLYVKKGNEYVVVDQNSKYNKNTQYYKLTTSANSTYYLQSRQANQFINATFTNDKEDWTVINGGIYNRADGSLVAQPDGKKLASVATKGQQLSSETVSLRAVYEARETHPMNHFSTKSASHIIDFMYNVFGVPTGAKYKAPTNQTWLLKEVFAIFGMVGMFGLIVVLVDFFLKTKAFAPLAATEEEKVYMLQNTELLKKPRRHVTYWLGGLLTAIWGAYSLSKVSKWYSNSMFRALITNTTSRITGLTYTDWANIGQIAYWGITCAIFGLAVTAVIAFVNKMIDMIKYKDDYENQAAPSPFAPFKIRSFGNVLRTLLLASLIVVIFYGLIFAFWKVFVVDFRFWTFDFKVFKMNNLLSYLRYVPFFFIFYMANAALNQGFRTKDLPECVTILINVIFNTVGLMILMGSQNAHFIQTGALISGDNKLFYIACYPIIPCVMFATVLSRRLYQRTGTAWLAGLINATIFTILACANTSMNGMM